MFVGGVDGGSIFQFSPTTQNEWGRSHRDILHLPKEETRVGRLVVSNALPSHRVSILMVVPQRVDGVIGRVGSGVDTQCGIVSKTQDNFLSPIADDVALG